MMTDRFDLAEQFLLCRDPKQIPQGWPIHSSGKWRLGHHPSLPVVKLLDRNRVPLGWLLGYAVDANGLLLDSQTVTVPLEGPTDYEGWIYDHGGRYLVVLITATSARVYLDPCGSLSAVYCPVLECVGSTPSMIPRDGDTGELTDLVRLVGIPRDSMFPLSLTPRKNVLRLLPNHFLDLDKWHAIRHWPRTEALPIRDTTEVVDRVVNGVQRNLAGLVAKRPVLLRLTAGLDSRMLLACARPWIESMTMFCAQHEPADETSWLDCSTASRLAKGFGLRYMRLPRRPPRRDDLEEWLFRTGWSVGEERGWRACTTYQGLPPGHADLIALAGEVARGFYWRPEDSAQTALEPDRLLTYFSAGQHPQSRGTIQGWLDTVPFRDPFLILDLFYIEQRLGCWGGVFPYAFAQQGRFQFFPLCHRQIIEGMLSLPTPVRGTDHLAREVMQREWPELLSYPINRPFGVQRIGPAWFKARRASTRASRAAHHPLRTGRRLIERVRQSIG